MDYLHFSTGFSHIENKTRIRGHILFHLCLLCALNPKQLFHQNLNISKQEEISEIVSLNLSVSGYNNNKKNEVSELNPLSQAGQLFHDAHGSMGHSLSCTDPQLNSSMWQWQWAWTSKETTFCILIQAKGRREGMGFSPAALSLNSRTPWESACTVLIESYYFTQHCIQCQQRYKKERGSILWFVDPLVKKRTLEPLSPSSDLGEAANISGLSFLTCKMRPLEFLHGHYFFKLTFIQDRALHLLPKY